MDFTEPRGSQGALRHAEGLLETEDMRLALREVAEILGSSCGVGEKMAAGYSIDSRTLLSGELFFALRGPRFDGHNFVRQAFEKGAVAAVVEEGYRAGAEAKWRPALVGVPDTTGALQRLARTVRERWGRRVVGVTGSTGKTTAKELIAAGLATRFSVLKSPGNLNNAFGLPLALLGLEASHQVGVVELGMSAPGEIAHLARIALPQVGVVTNVAPAHLQFFDSVDSIARAKRELIENLRSPACAVLNYDDSRVRRFGESFDGRVVTFGFEAGAEFRAYDFRAAEGLGIQFRVEAPGFNLAFRLPLPGRHNAQNALAAIAVATVFEISPADLQRGLANVKTLPSRCEILTLSGPVTLIDDSYNSNPLAMEQMLETLKAWPGAQQRIAVAGEMLELGPTSAQLHHDIGRKCVECGVDWLFAVQGDARYFVEGAREAGLAADHTGCFDRPEQAAESCRRILRPGDVVLVKGSRGVHLEKVSELLKESLPNPAITTTPWNRPE